MRTGSNTCHVYTHGYTQKCACEGVPSLLHVWTHRCTHECLRTLEKWQVSCTYAAGSSYDKSEFDNWLTTYAIVQCARTYTHVAPMLGPVCVRMRAHARNTRARALAMSRRWGTATIISCARLCVNMRACTLTYAAVQSCASNMPMQCAACSMQHTVCGDGSGGGGGGE